VFKWLVRLAGIMEKQIKKNYNYTIIRIGSCAGLIIGPGKTTGHLPIKNGRLSYVIMS